MGWHVVMYLVYRSMCLVIPVYRNVSINTIFANTVILNLDLNSYSAEPLMIYMMGGSIKADVRTSQLHSIHGRGQGFQHILEDLNTWRIDSNA